MRRYYNPTGFTGLFGMQEEQHLNGKFERRTSNHEQQIAGKRFNYYWYLHSVIHSCHLRGKCGKCYSVDFYVLSRYFFFVGRSIFHYAGNKGTEIWCSYHLGRDCWLALFGAWHGVNTSVFCCCLYHCTIHPFKRWV